MTNAEDEKYFGRLLEKSKNNTLTCRSYHLVYTGWLNEPEFMAFTRGLDSVKLSVVEVLFAHVLDNKTHVYIEFNKAPERVLKFFTFVDSNNNENIPSIYSTPQKFLPSMVKNYIKLYSVPPPTYAETEELINIRRELIQKKDKQNQKECKRDRGNNRIQENIRPYDDDSKTVLVSDSKRKILWSKLTPLERSKVRSKIMSVNNPDAAMSIANRYNMPAPSLLVEKILQEGKEFRTEQAEKLTQIILGLVPLQKKLFNIVEEYLKNPNHTDLYGKMLWVYSENGYDGNGRNERRKMLQYFRYLRSIFLNSIIVINTGTSRGIFALLKVQIDIMIKRRERSGQGKDNPFIFFIDLPEDFKDNTPKSKFYTGLIELADERILGKKPLIIVSANMYPIINPDTPISGNRWIIFQMLRSFKRLTFWSDYERIDEIRQRVFNIELNNRKLSRGLSPGINSKILNDMQLRLRESYFSIPSISKNKISDIFFMCPSLKKINERLKIEDGILQEVKNFFVTGITEDEAVNEYKMTEKEITDYLEPTQCLKRRSLYFAIFRRRYQNMKMKARAREMKKNGYICPWGPIGFVEKKCKKLTNVMNNYYNKINDTNGSEVDTLKKATLDEIINGVYSSMNNEESLKWINCKFMNEYDNEDSEMNCHIRDVRKELLLSNIDRFSSTSSEELLDELSYKRTEKPTFTDAEIKSNKAIEDNIITIMNAIDNKNINTEISVAADEAIRKYEEANKEKNAVDNMSVSPLYPTIEEINADKKVFKSMRTDEYNDLNRELISGYAKTHKKIPCGTKTLDEIQIDVVGSLLFDIPVTYTDASINRSSEKLRESGDESSIPTISCGKSSPVVLVDEELSAPVLGNKNEIPIASSSAVSTTSIPSSSIIIIGNKNDYDETYKVQKTRIP